MVNENGYGFFEKWAVKLKTLLLFVVLLGTGCSESDDADSEAGGGGEDTWGAQIPLQAVTGNAAFTVEANVDYLNVMQSAMPTIPTNFPQAKPKPSKATGYVADLTGKPLQGAIVKIRSTLVGGTYSSASGQTNANGYYEILVPVGAAEYQGAGYTIGYGIPDNETGRAALSLYPADGKIESFESTGGKVKNFVLLSYGLADVNTRAADPSSAAGYFGGSLYLNYSLKDPGDSWSSGLPRGGEIIITLTPLEALYGVSKTFTITRKLGQNSVKFYINNIPVGRYTITAKLSDGRNVTMTHSGPYSGQFPFQGLKPSPAVGTGVVAFTPSWIEAGSASPNRGEWRPVDIRLTMP